MLPPASTQVMSRRAAKRRVQVERLIWCIEGQEKSRDGMISTMKIVTLWIYGCSNPERADDDDNDQPSMNMTEVE